MGADSDVSEKLPEAGPALEFLIGRANEQRQLWVGPCLSSQIVKGSIATAIEKKAHKRSKIKLALMVLLPSWRHEQRADSLKYSRRQLLERLIPKVGEKGRANSLMVVATKVETIKQLTFRFPNVQYSSAGHMFSDASPTNYC